MYPLMILVYKLAIQEGLRALDFDKSSSARLSEDELHLHLVVEEIDSTQVFVCVYVEEKKMASSHLSVCWVYCTSACLLQMSLVYTIITLKKPGEKCIYSFKSPSSSSCASKLKKPVFY